VNVYPPRPLIAGRYEVASRPMMGGMGIVYFCVDKQEELPVALKTFRPELMPNRNARDRFLREGTTWIELGSHPHVVRCYQVLTTDVGLETFLVLELVTAEQGKNNASLRSWLIPGQPLPMDQALVFAIQIARGMRFATEKLTGFVHRDLKPENILVGADKLSNWKANRLRVTDFGLAAFLESLDTLPQAAPVEITENKAILHTQLTHGVVGTPLYMAPEQWQHGKVGIYTDVYALGCILIEMLSGNPAAVGKTISELQGMHCEGKLRTLADKVPEQIRKVVRMCSIVDPTARYQLWNDVEIALLDSYEVLTGQKVPDTLSGQQMNRDNRVAVGWSYYSIGHSYVEISKFDLAQRYFERVKSIGQTEDEPVLEAAGLGGKGDVYDLLGQFENAIKCFEQSLVISRTIGDRLGESTSLGYLGKVYRNLGDFQRAIQCFDQSLEIARAIGDVPNQGAALGDLATVYHDMGELHRAIQFCDQALTIAHSIGNLAGESGDLGTLGNIYLKMNEYQRAINSFNESLTISRAIGDQHREGDLLGNLGVAYRHLGELQRALDSFQESLEVARAIGNQQGQSSALNNMGNTYRNLGEVSRAIECLEQSLDISRAINDRASEPRTIFSLALSYAQKSDIARASQLAREAVDLFLALGLREDARHVEDWAAELTKGGEVTSSRQEGQALQMFKAAHQAFRYVRSLDEMRRTAHMYPLMMDPYFMAILEQAVEVSPENRASFGQRVTWLKKIMDEQNPSAAAPARVNVAQAIWDAFNSAGSFEAMQAVVEQYPILIDKGFGFIQAAKENMNQIPPHDRAAVEKRLAWLKQIARKQRPSFFDRLFSKKG